MKPFIGKQAHFKWARKSNIQGNVCVLLRTEHRNQPIEIMVGRYPNGNLLLWGRWITEAAQ